MVSTGQNTNLNKVDFSFIPSLRCNLRCSFCMYNASPDNDLELNYGKVKDWLDAIDWSRIGSCGFYGGEPSIDTPRYEMFMNLVPLSIPKFIITNGSWSDSSSQYLGWCSFITKRIELGEDLRVVISNTSEHRKFQCKRIIDLISKRQDVIVKDDDEIHPMGRAYYPGWKCTNKCLWHKQPSRLAIFPTGDIVFQNCDGIYPVVGSMNDSFDCVLNKVTEIRKNTCNHSGYNVNNIMGIGE